MKEGLLCMAGVLIKITGTTYVPSWSVDCCAVYPKTLWPGKASGLANDGLRLPVRPLCRRGLFRSAGRADVFKNGLPWTRYSCSGTSG